MQNVRKINNDLFYIGCNDRKIALFESVYPVKSGVSYNSYLLNDDKTILFDTVDKSCSCQFFENLNYALNGKSLDYFIINHIEPDHSALIKELITKYKNVKIICNQKLKQMLFQFFDFDEEIEKSFLVVKEGDIIETKNHKFTFVMAPMVHWPEVMVTYDINEKILFSADAFGSFGAIDGNLFDFETELNIDEYRRYYSNIVGKYGAQVLALLNKAKNLDIKMICPLHGRILSEKIPEMIEKYQKWANYEPEIKSVLIAYSSVYGGTQNAVDIIASKLAQKGVKNIKVYDVAHYDNSFVLSDAFKYSHILFATTTYNNNIFVAMDNFVSNLVKHNLQNRTFAIVENGSWACNCGGQVKEKLKELKGSKFIEKQLTIKSTLKSSQNDDIDELVDLIVDDLG